MSDGMTVRQLIEALQRAAPDAVVQVQGCTDGLCGSSVLAVDLEDGVLLLRDA